MMTFVRGWAFTSMLMLAGCGFGMSSGGGDGYEGEESSAGPDGQTTSGGTSLGSTTQSSASGASSSATTPSGGTTAETSMSSGGGTVSEDSGDSDETEESGSGEESSGTGGRAGGTLDVVRLEIACMGTSNCSASYCDTVGTASAAQTFVGEDGVTYDVTLRLRGVLEQKTYLGGTTTGFWNDGGSPQVDDWNTYQLEISDPPQLYYINAGSTGNSYSDAVDYSRTVPMRNGATVTATMFDSSSCGAYNVDSDGTPIVIDGIPPAPDPFDGQFVQIDATAIVPQ